MKVGDKYGRLTITKWIVGKIRGRFWVNAVCECGVIGTYIRGNLAAGNTRSCGCLQREHSRAFRLKHGLAETCEYATWMNIKNRCSRPSSSSYKNYGAKGIKVCDRWLESFENFYADMGPRPTNKHSIDRINPFGNYEPNNCRWATSMEQHLNKRDSYAAKLGILE